MEIEAIDISREEAANLLSSSDHENIHCRGYDADDPEAFVEIYHDDVVESGGGPIQLPSHWNSFQIWRTKPPTIYPDRKPRLLELFAGTKSIGKEFEKLGFEVVSLDFDPQFETDIVTDILTLPEDFFAKDNFDVVWASPPCNAFSVAVIGRNWTHDHKPKNDFAVNGLAILEHTVKMIKATNPKVWFIENPRGKMRKMPVMQQFNHLNDKNEMVPTNTVAYCQYGDFRQKPTDIWTNLSEWEPKPMCKRGATCHVAAPRGSQTGTQGMANSIEKGIIPEELCAEIAWATIWKLNKLKTAENFLSV
jgi:hypothetical protein